MVTNAYYYSMYGLTVRSEIQIPDLETPGVYIDGTNGAIVLGYEQQPDLRVKLGPVDTSVFSEDGHWFSARNEHDAVIRIPNVANYAIQSGTRITVDPFPHADQSQVLLFLLGSAMGCLLHQRKLIPLHVSAIHLDGLAWAFTAPSGTGKSTLAARLQSLREVHLISDDVALIDVSGDQPMLVPGVPITKVSRDLARQLFDSKHLRTYGTESGKLKAQPVGTFIKEAIPLAGIILLERMDLSVRFFEASKLSGAARLLAARESIYRYQFGRAMHSDAYMAGVLFRLATHVNFYKGELGCWDCRVSGIQENQLIEQLRGL